MVSSFKKVWNFSKHLEAKKPLKNLRLAAMAVALTRLEKAMKLRGQAW